MFVTIRPKIRTFKSNSLGMGQKLTEKGWGLEMFSLRWLHNKRETRVRGKGQLKRSTQKAKGVEK